MNFIDVIHQADEVNGTRTFDLLVAHESQIQGNIVVDYIECIAAIIATFNGRCRLVSFVLCK